MKPSDVKWELATVAWVVAFLAVLQLEPVWSAYTWPYLWGPVVADAAGHDVGGIGSGYTPVSTLTYSALTIVSLLLVHRVLKRLGVPIDRTLIMSAVPFIALGPTVRVLEDAGYFDRPTAFMFISPLVYVTIAGTFFLTMAVAALIARVGRPGSTVLMVLFLIALSFLTMAVSTGTGWTSPVTIIFVTGSMILVFVATPLRPERSALTFFAGLHLLFLSWMPITKWLADGRWDGGAAVDRHAWVVPAVVLASLALTVLVAVVWRYAHSAGLIRVAPMGLPLFFAHFLDGTATAIGIEHFGAWEKHPLPRELISVTGNAAVMIPMKFLVVALFVYLVTGPYRRDMEKEPALYNLLYLAVFILGFAPGLRDMLRLAMGV